MGLGGPVADRFRVGIRLVPDDSRAQPTAVALERQREPPGHADEVPGLEPLRGRRLYLDRPRRILPVAGAVPAVPGNYPEGGVGGVERARFGGRALQRSFFRSTRK